MTHTTTDAAEARALTVSAYHRAHHVFQQWDKHPDAPAYWIRLPSWVKDYAAACVIATERRLATVEAASGAGEHEATQDEYATVEDWEHDDQRELSLLYNHRADDSLQFNRGQMREAIRHGKRLASLPPATDPAIPDGWALVPVEITEAMLDAALKRYPDQSPIALARLKHALRLDWSAALAAAPTIPATGERECPSSPDGRHQVDTSMESGPNNCFHCEAPMGGK